MAADSYYTDSKVTGNRERFGLTPRMRSCLEFIKHHQRLHGVTPTYEEIMVGLGLRSKSNVARLVYALEDRGAVRRKAHGWNGLVIVGEDPVDTTDAIECILARCKLSRNTRVELGELLEFERENGSWRSIGEVINGLVEGRK